MNTRFSVRSFFILYFSLTAFASFAQEKPKKKKFVSNGSAYLSWGYNREWYTFSDIHISQPSLNNDYTFEHVRAHDHPGWTDHLLQKALTIPQYNYRIGYFFNEDQTWGMEINFDHTKFVVTQGHDVRVKGTLNGREVDTVVNTAHNVLNYQLNNGANFLEFNMVRKLKLLDVFHSRFRLDCLLKAGAGPVIPHVENTIFGMKNKPHFQFGGWNADADVSFRATFFKHVFLEYANKGVYARYSHLRIYEGLAKQSFGCYEMFLCLGLTFRW